MSERCTYCHGARLVGWSGAGPILCPTCSRGKDAFTVITEAWREQRSKAVELESALAREKARADEAGAELTRLRERVAALEPFARRFAVQACQEPILIRGEIGSAGCAMQPCGECEPCTARAALDNNSPGGDS